MGSYEGERLYSPFEREHFLPVPFHVDDGSHSGLVTRIHRDVLTLDVGAFFAALAIPAE